MRKGGTGVSGRDNVDLYQQYKPPSRVGTGTPIHAPQTHDRHPSDQRGPRQSNNNYQGTHASNSYIQGLEYQQHTRAANAAQSGGNRPGSGFEPSQQSEAERNRARAVARDEVDSWGIKGNLDESLRKDEAERKKLLDQEKKRKDNQLREKIAKEQEAKAKKEKNKREDEKRREQKREQEAQKIKDAEEARRNGFDSEDDRVTIQADLFNLTGQKQHSNLVSSKSDLLAPAQGGFYGGAKLPTAKKIDGAAESREERRKTLAASSSKSSLDTAKTSSKNPFKKAVTVITDDSDAEYVPPAFIPALAYDLTDALSPTRTSSSPKKRSKTTSDNTTPPSKKSKTSKGKSRIRSSPSADVDSITLDDSPEKPRILSISEQLAVQAAEAEAKEIKRQKREAKKAGISGTSKKEKKKKKVDEFQLDTESDSSEDGSEAMEDEDDADLMARMLRKENAEKVRNGGTPDLLLDSEDEALDDQDLCPFCSNPLPDEPTKQLLDLRTYLLSRDHAVPNPTRKNPKAVRLPVIETASFCRKHEEENVIIPEGRRNGWPETIDWDKLHGRIESFTEDLTNIIYNKTPSTFLDAAKAEWEQKGARKMANVMSEWGSFDVEQPGYYGPRGFEQMIKSLNECFIEIPLLNARRAAPLPVDAYLRRVLIPELTIRLIAQDMGQSREVAKETAVESRAYGKAMFASSDEDKAWAKEEEKRYEKEAKKLEKKKRRGEEEAEKKRIEEEGEAEEARREKKRRKEKAENKKGEKEALENAKAFRRNNGMEVEDGGEVPSKPAMRVPKARLAMQAAAAGGSKVAGNDTAVEEDHEWGRSWDHEEPLQVPKTVMRVPKARMAMEAASAAGKKPDTAEVDYDWGPRDKATSPPIVLDESDDEVEVERALRPANGGSEARPKAKAKGDGRGGFKFREVEEPIKSRKKKVREEQVNISDSE
ncbi:hypothetical protein P7C70_g7219, partial [Phenoliferia sp. Uapishka_3]